MSVVTATVMDVLRTLGVLLAGSAVGLAGALLVGWEIGWIRGHRGGARPPRPPHSRTDAQTVRPPAPPAVIAAAPILQTPKPATDPGPTIPAPDPVVAREVSAGAGGESDAGRHRDLYEQEYARQLARLDARRMQIATGMAAVAHTNGNRMPGAAPPRRPEPEGG